MTKRAAAVVMVLGFGLGACGGGGRGGGAVSAFCSLIKKDNQQIAGGTNVDNAAARSALQEVARAAPSAVKPDLKTLVDDLVAVDAGHKPTTSEIAKLNDATKRIEQYVKDKCGA